MPLLEPDQLPGLFDDVVAGRVRLVVWGAVEVAGLYQWLCPLPISYYVDTDWHRWRETLCGVPIRSPSALDDEDPAGVVVALNYYMLQSLDQLCRFLDERGGIRYFIPMPIASVWRRASRAPAVPAPSALLEQLVLAPVNDRETALAWRGAAGEGHWDRLARLLAEHRRKMAEAGEETAREGAVLFVECLHVGGAERQLVNLAAGLRRRGWNTAVAVTHREPPETAHYLDYLRANGVEYRLVGLPGTQAPDDLLATIRASVDPSLAALLWHVPPHLVPSVLALYLFLRERRPKMVVCYLDRPNILGAMAAVMAGVPAVLMSGRNVNPTHFPHFYTRQTDHMLGMYRALLASGGARMSANSAVGAQSYADWLGLDRARVPVIPNCIAEGADAPVAEDALRGFRALMGVPEDAPLVLGVFRLSPEKRPFLFLEVFARLSRHFPRAHALICGHGSMQDAVRRRAAELGVADRVNVLGGVRNVPLVMRASDVLLHVAEHEGMPNALLEAQAVGLPVVCARAPGSLEVLAPALEGFSRDAGDVDAMVEDCRALLADPSLRRRLGEQARRHVVERHSLGRLVDDTLAVAFRQG